MTASMRYEPKRTLIVHELSHASAYFRKTGSSQIDIWHIPGGMITETPSGYSGDTVSVTMAGPIIDFVIWLKRYPKNHTELFDNASMLRHSESDLTELRKYSESELEASFKDAVDSVSMLDELLDKSPQLFTSVFSALSGSDGARIDFERMDVVPLIEIKNLNLSSEELDMVTGLYQSLSESKQ